MEQKNHSAITWFLGIVAVLVVTLAGISLAKINWGTVAFEPAQTVTVSGMAQSEQSNQLAVFSAGVMFTNEDRDTAVTQVNEAIEKVIQSLHDFGIPNEDIKTQNLSIYRVDEPLFQGDRLMLATDARSVWQANNTIEVRLRDVSRASELADLLASSGASNVYGPTFQLDQGTNPEDALIDQAIENAREKAAQIAVSSDRELGPVLNVVEGSSGGGVFPLFADRAMGGGVSSAPVEPGTSTISKSVTVTFQLKSKSILTWIRERVGF